MVNQKKKVDEFLFHLSQDSAIENRIQRHRLRCCRPLSNNSIAVVCKPHSWDYSKNTNEEERKKHGKNCWALRTAMCTHVCYDVCMVAGEMGYFWHNTHRTAMLPWTLWQVDWYCIMIIIILVDCCVLCVPYWTKLFSLFLPFCSSRTTTKSKSMTVSIDKRSKSID